MKPALLVLAAGMGSRYGGLKQLDSVGPNGETIMDYSVFDAIRGGFGRAVFVIRKDFEDDFRRKVLARYERHIAVETVFQSLDRLPAGFVCPPERTKPWGTNHAVMAGRDAIREPFAVINADDFYGRDSFAVMGKELEGLDAGENAYCMVGFRVGNTLSESGPVARGVCEVDGGGRLLSVVERTAIERVDGRICFRDERGETVYLDDNTPVSMNMWGFTPGYFDFSEAFFREFLRTELNNPKSEYFIPLMVNELAATGRTTVRVLDTASKWFGVTYREDRPGVEAKIRALIRAGEYPERLFGGDTQ
ncbi:MAG: nucleotidyltransferase [Tannerella sp.]|jgi:hypothetical protein|nr:nucleotidyltransferase [Tannerella sp.]